MPVVKRCLDCTDSKVLEFAKMACRICKSRTQNLQFFGAEF